MPESMHRKKYGESHMDRGLSYANAPQGYRSDAGKPMGYYGKPPNGYINQSGMPNASRMRRAMDYMSNYYGGQMGGGASPVMYGGGNPGAENRSGNRGTSSGDAGTSPKTGSMDKTYKKKGKMKYA